jgi:hypothetical protein
VPFRADDELLQQHAQILVALTVADIHDAFNGWHILSLVVLNHDPPPIWPCYLDNKQDHQEPPVKALMYRLIEHLRWVPLLDKERKKKEG